MTFYTGSPKSAEGNNGTAGMDLEGLSQHEFAKEEQCMV